MSEEAEAMANALRDTVEKLASTGSSLSLIEWSEASNRILHAASLIRSQAERIKRLTEAVGSRAIHEEYDFPGDAPEFCGWFCDECKSVIEADGSGHDANCLAHGIKPLGKRADKARARAAATAIRSLTEKQNGA